MTAHISPVTPLTPAAASQAPPEKPKNTEKQAYRQAVAQDSVNISSAGRAASQTRAPQKSTGDVDHDADSK